MALTSLAYHRHELAVTNWQPKTLDEILHICDSQFLDAFQRALIPDAPNLSVEQVPTTVCFVTSNDGNSDLPKRGNAYLDRFLFPALGGGDTWPTNIRGRAAGKSKKLTCPGVKLPKMIPCPGVKFSQTIPCPLDSSDKFVLCKEICTKSIEKCGNIAIQVI